MKLWNYMVIFTGVAIFMSLAGLPLAGFDNLYARIGVNITTNSTGSVDEGIQSFSGGNSSFWNYFFDSSTGILITLVGTGLIALGVFIFTKDKKLAMLPALIGVFALWISVLVSIINYGLGYKIWGTIAALIMIPLTIGFVVTCIEWFAGE